MDTYYTVEEKYLQAVEEMHYGETPLSLKLLNQILAMTRCLQGHITR